MIITNFAMPDITKESIADYYEIVSHYLFFKKYPLLQIKIDGNGINNREYYEVLEEVSKNFEFYYGEFLSAILCDIPAVIIPLQRIAQNPYLNQLFDLTDIGRNDEEIINISSGNSVAKYFFTARKLLQCGFLGEKSQCFLGEIGSYEGLLRGLRISVLLGKGKIKLREDVQRIKEYFELDKNLYQFPDKAHSNLFFDIVLNQLAYPMHNNILCNERFQYIAKTNCMFTDVTIYDKCRYIYEWLPGLHQIVSSFENTSWQYVFPFALDGLVKMRQNYNNEFFFRVLLFQIL